MTKYFQYSDEHLIHLLQSGNRDAFSEIYSRYSSLLYNYAYNILENEDECMDAVQDIFVWLWINRQKLQVSCLKAYLLAAVKYKLVRVIRTSKRRSEILSRRAVVPDAFIDDSVEVKELKAVINDFVKTLPQRAREIYLLSREQQLSNKEIAVQLGITEKTVENQMTLTLKKLKLHLGKMSFWSVFL
ncbi:RNA polymerase sigma factor [Niabella aquatica]